MATIYTEVDWAAVDPLLGTMPDKMLARYVPMSQAVLCVRRKKLGIAKYSRDKYDWEEPDRLMGRVPDHEIARRFCLRQSTVTKRRQKLGIEPAKVNRLSKAVAYCPRGEVSRLASLFAVRPRPELT